MDPKDEADDKMSKVRAALKEVNQRNRDLGLRKSKKDKKRKRSKTPSSDSDDVMIVNTDNTDIIITRADTALTAANARAEKGDGTKGASQINLDEGDAAES